MPFTSPANHQRAEIFDGFQAAALEAAGNPGVVAELGEHAVALRGIVEQAYLLNVKHGTVTVPRPERNQDNVGVVIADGQIGVVNASQYFASMPLSEVARMRQAGLGNREAAHLGFLAATKFYNLGQRQALQVDAHTGGRHVCMKTTVPRDLTKEHFLVRSRSLISFGSDIIANQPAVRGSTFLHEADHVLFARTMVSDNPELYASTDIAMRKTMTERRAHFVSYTVLKHLGVYEDYPSFEELAEMDRIEGSSVLHGLATGKNSALQFSSFLAMVLTRTYGSFDEPPSLQEIGTYSRFGLTNTMASSDSQQARRTG